MTEEKKLLIEEVIAHFDTEGKLIEKEPFGNGHINDTFLLTYKLEDGSLKKIILQKMNKYVFKKPVELMQNVVGVTSFLRERIIENGGDPERETLNVILDMDGNPYYLDSQGEYWREYVFIPNAVCYERVENDELFYQSAVGLGKFQKLLADYSAETLFEVIPGFHDTTKRFAAFKEAVEEDVKGRADSVREEIQFVLEREDVADYFGECLKKGEIPLRVTHNDTKLNNVMIDEATGKALCMIDLDTVMPGLSMNDFGDSIRFGASTAAEDEQDLSKVSCSMHLFDVYTRGFMEACGDSLTDREIELLPMGAKVMTYECGMRFLMDYLQGDVYFKIAREQHNLDRARTQFKLVKEMEEKWDTMHEIVVKYR